MKTYLGLWLFVVTVVCAVGVPVRAADPAKSPAIQSDHDLVGTWNVQMVVRRSTCDAVAAGDSFAEQWTISIQKGSMIAHVIGGATGIESYWGHLEEDGTLTFTNNESLDQKVGIRLIEMHGDASNLTGHRTVAQPGADGLLCLIFSKVSISRVH